MQIASPVFLSQRLKFNKIHQTNPAEEHAG